MKTHTRYYVAMKKMQLLGETHFRAGLPITAFPNREDRKKAAGKQAAIFPDRSRAAYEMGWRGAKEVAS